MTELQEVLAESFWGFFTLLFQQLQISLTLKTVVAAMIVNKSKRGILYELCEGIIEFEAALNGRVDYARREIHASQEIGTIVSD